ncbi:uncharacterized protein C20orf96 homolog [Eublepharis macularius]|uniref:Uncharacterized protein C20orf96 homolog n=1 Tax=Eublepharis macularius TaxID=481883 RepID=A0AA97L0G4_EUBMA|nr:uncharacterized protein C20orf96 homolog [Eublepharis macularius]
MSQKTVDNLPKSFLSTLTKTDYSKWQRSKAVKKSPTFKVFLPPIEPAAGKKKEDEKSSSSKPKDKLSGKKSTSGSSLKSARFRRKSAYQRALESEMLRKSTENIKILQQLSKGKKNSLEVLKHHSHFLLEKNRGLFEDILEKDADMARCARDLLQQYDMFGAIIMTLQDSSQNQVGVAKAELEATEKMVEKNMGKLEQDLSRMNAKVQALQEELNVLRTYMDKEFPVKSVQIAFLLRSIRHLSEEQQDELEEAEEMSKQFLETVAEKTQEETERILQAVVDEKVSEYHTGLKQMAKNNRELQRQIEIQKKITADLEKDIEVLQKSTVKLRQSVQHPREVIFADVLLRRPICTPDMEIALNIPTEEDFPL